MPKFTWTVVEPSFRWKTTLDNKDLEVSKLADGSYELQVVSKKTKHPAMNYRETAERHFLAEAELLHSKMGDAEPSPPAEPN